MTDQSKQHQSMHSGFGAQPNSRMSDLAETFHSIADFHGVRPWNAVALDEYAVRNGSSGACAAAAFVLHLWNSRIEWKVGPFMLRASLGMWDVSQRAAFQAWAKDVWLP